MSDGMAPTVRAAADMTAAELRVELADAEAHCRRLEDDLEGEYWKARQYEWIKAQLGAVHEFVADVQRGIRSLDEYEAVCGPDRWEDECPAAKRFAAVTGTHGPSNTV